MNKLCKIATNVLYTKPPIKKFSIIDTSFNQKQNKLHHHIHCANNWTPNGLVSPKGPLEGVNSIWESNQAINIAKVPVPIVYFSLRVWLINRLRGQSMENRGKQAIKRALFLFKNSIYQTLRNIIILVSIIHNAHVVIPTGLITYNRVKIIFYRSFRQHSLYAGIANWNERVCRDFISARSEYFRVPRCRIDGCREVPN